MYKEQPVTVFADFSLKNSREPFPFDYRHGYEEYTWEIIEDAAGGFGKSCTFLSSLTVVEISYKYF